MKSQSEDYNNSVNKLETYKSFQHTDLIDSIKFDKLLSLQNDIFNRPALIIDEFGVVTEDPSDKPSHVTNKGSNEDLSKVFSPEFVELFMIIRDKIIEAGASNPKLVGFLIYRNPDSMAWHRDFNYDNLPDDKIWRAFYTLYPSEQLENFKSELFIAPDSIWPNIWNLQLYNNLVGNMLTGHTQSFGHEYKAQGDHVDFNDILGMTWYDEIV